MFTGYTPKSDQIIKIAYDANENIEYVGFAAPGSNTNDNTWKLIKLEYNVGGNITDVIYAEGNLNFDKIWDSRTSYTYS